MDDGVLKFDSIKLEQDREDSQSNTRQPYWLENKYANLIPPFEPIPKRITETFRIRSYPEGTFISRDHEKIKKINEDDEEDYNMDYCGVCGSPGTLICCETCPGAYHIECLGFERVIIIKF